MVKIKIINYSSKLNFVSLKIWTSFFLLKFDRESEKNIRNNFWNTKMGK